MHHGPVGRVERPTGAEFNRAEAWSGGDVSSLVRTRHPSRRRGPLRARRAWWFPCRCVIDPERERDAAGRVPPPVPLGHRDPSLRVLFAHHVHGVTPTTSRAPGARMNEWSMAGSSHSRYSADGGQPERERFWRMRFLAASIVAVTPPSFGFLHVSARSCMGDVSVSFSLRFRGRHCGRDSITGLGRPEVRRPRPARTERLRGATDSLMRSSAL